MTEHRMWKRRTLLGLLIVFSLLGAAPAALAAGAVGPERSGTNGENVYVVSAESNGSIGKTVGTVGAERTAAMGPEQAIAVKQPNIAEAKTSTIERIGRFLTDPVVRTVLLILGIAGIAIELIVPGFGIPGIVGIAAFGLYFFGHYIIGFAGMEDVVLFIIGIVLLASELFIPSFGILGTLGAGALIAGVVLAAPDPQSALYSLIVALLAAAAVVFVVARRFRHRGVWNKFILRDSLTSKEGYVASADKSPLLGMRGTAITTLRPAGTARIGGERIDVVTDGEFVPAGTPVEVVKVEGTRVVVEPCSEAKNI